jgi:hypothetical protein
VNDAERLRHDPAMRWIVGGKAAHSDAASPSQMCRFETQWLARTASGTAITPAPAITRCSCSTSSVIWNAVRYVPATCTVPMAGSCAQAGRCTLPGQGLAYLFPGGRGLCNARVYEFLEAERIKYAIRLPANQILQHRIGCSSAQSDDRRNSRATDRRSASKCQGKWPDQNLDQAFGLPEVLVAVSTSRLSCKRAGKTRTLMPIWHSSGESRIIRPDSGRHSRTLGELHLCCSGLE